MPSKMQQRGGGGRINANGPPRYLTGTRASVLMLIVCVVLPYCSVLGRSALNVCPSLCTGGRQPQLFRRYITLEYLSRAVNVATSDHHDHLRCCNIVVSVSHICCVRHVIIQQSTSYRSRVGTVRQRPIGMCALRANAPTNMRDIFLWRVRNGLMICSSPVWCSDNIQPRTHVC